MIHQFQSQNKICILIIRNRQCNWNDNSTLSYILSMNRWKWVGHFVCLHMYINFMLCVVKLWIAMN